MWIPTTAMLIGMMEQLVGNDTISALGNASIGLFRAPFSPRNDSVFSDLTEATYDGYARQNKPFDTSAISIGQNGKVLALGGPLVFAPTGSDTPNTIYGQFLANGASDSPSLMAAEVFDQPIQLTSPLTIIVDVGWFGLDPAGNYGMSGIST